MLLQISGTPQYFQCHWIHSVIFLDSLENPPLEAVGAEEDQSVLSVAEVCSQLPVSLSPCPFVFKRSQPVHICVWICTWAKRNPYVGITFMAIKFPGLCS